MKYPTDKQIDDLVNTYEESLVRDFIGFTKAYINIDDAVADYRLGIEDAIKLIKKLNSEQSKSE